MKTQRQTYQQKAEKLANAIDIGCSLILASKLGEDQKKKMEIGWSALRYMALNPEPQFKKVKSLEYLEVEFLYYWNESNGEMINEFWKELESRGIDYKHKDIFKDIFKRSRIKNMIEYDYVIDEMLSALQSGRISETEYANLNRMLLDFEKKGKCI